MIFIELKIKKGTIIACDFDMTIAITEYPKIISPIQETIDFLNSAKSKGAIIILWTCREGKPLQEAVEWCRRFQVPIDYINETPKERTKLYGMSGTKVSADIYIDDKAINVKDLKGMMNNWIM